MNCENIVEQVLENNGSIVLISNHLNDEMGIVSCQILKKHFSTKHIPVIFYSTNHDIADLATQAGSDFYLPRPFEIKRLENLLSEAYELFDSGNRSEGLQVS